MTPDVITCSPGEAAGIVVRRMLRRGVRTRPVIEDGCLVGGLSRHDLLRLFERPDGEIRARVAEVLDDPFWAPQGHAVQAEVLDGVVILTGSVLHPSDRRVVHNRISQVPGVIEVADRLTWREPEPEPA
jgi:CBS domain-containing protein